MVKEIHARTAAAWTVGWGFSTRCDLACPFCYSAQVRRGSEVSEAELALAERFLATNGPSVRSFNFGTGECFLAPTFPQLLALCQLHAPQAAVAVTTNGALADVPASLREEMGARLHEIDVSLDFARPEAHDRWRGRPGTWRRATRAIEAALELGLKTSIVMIGAPQTLVPENLQGMLALAAGYGIALRVNLYMPTFGDPSFIPSPDAVRLLLEKLRAWSSAVRSSDRLLSTLLGGEAPDAAARRSCRILPDGRVSPSTYLLGAPWTLATTLDEIKLAGLEVTPPFARYAAPPLPAPCAACAFAARCGGGSVERRWLWGGDLEAPDPLCPLHQDNAALDDTPIAPQIGGWDGPQIHLDYLPTVVALPPRG
jgi:MoaA/NifB/PqqE/SkfB family radical SAM enzyme